ncbi:hypothetical protein X801_05114 [Opisthorchis viverrini]|uniref:Uncharacterized protein n=1 Tax=Opisthorchis viverrini TaxID=6198 RepID=A0A1S8WX35_OPIVI|nr:hypothetical protein X801_05114 [Opisthorchis viverrini]
MRIPRGSTTKHAAKRDFGAIGTTADVILASAWESDGDHNIQIEYESRKEFEENTLMTGEVLLFQPIIDENKAKISASFDDSKYKMSQMKDKLMTKVKPNMGSAVYITEIKGKSLEMRSQMKRN